MASRPVTAAQRTQYLKEVLALNPLREAEDIVSRRQRLWGDLPESKGSSAPVVGDDLQERRAAAQDQIADIRQNFWKTPLEGLQRRIKALKVDNLPDLRHAASRLWIVANYRDKFPQLGRDPDCDDEFLKIIKQVLVSSPRESAVLKEQLLAQLSGTARWKRLRRMLRLVKQQMPEIYQLEEDWLDSLQLRPRRRAVPSTASAVSGESQGISLNGWGWIIWVLLFVGLRILMVVAR